MNHFERKLRQQGKNMNRRNIFALVWGTALVYASPKETYTVVVRNPDSSVEGIQVSARSEIHAIRKVAKQLLEPMNTLILVAFLGTPEVIVTNHFASEYL